MNDHRLAPGGDGYHHEGTSGSPAAVPSAPGGDRDDNYSATYTIRVQGHLDDHWSSWLGAAALDRADDGTTCLTVPVLDQAQLHGVLAGLRNIGVTLTDVRTDAPIGAARPALERRLQTERLTLRAATQATRMTPGSTAASTPRTSG
jgi:hypothetical protein